MKHIYPRALAATFALLAMPLLAQNPPSTSDSTDKGTSATTPKDSTAKPATILTAPKIEIQHIRPMDQRGINIFETPKKDEVEYNGFKLAWGAAFTQQYQNLQHANTAAAKIVSGVDQNKLIRIGGGFNNAVANLYLNAQLAEGIRVQVTTYMSSRHHQEQWVKDGFVLVDNSPIKIAALENLMKYVTLRVGHFEVNYGDAHFRRTDNGNALFNPLVGNYIMDAFTTEIGGEVYFRTGPWLAMGSMTGGEVKGTITTPEKRSPAYIGKVGFDKIVSPDLRFRLTGSMFSQSKAASQTLYTGDRGGSRYYLVLENTAASTNAQAWSGAIQPGFGSEQHSWVINPFVKVAGLELFGNFEQARGRAATEATVRTWRQNVGEATYRLFDEKVYVAARYNTAQGELLGVTTRPRVNRTQFGGGWFVTPNVLGKLEYVKQNYHDFPSTDIRNGGKFKGFMMEGVISF